MDSTNHLLTKRAATCRGASESARLGHRPQSGITGSERYRSPALQSRWRLCRCSRHCRLHPIHPGITSSRANQSGDANRGADIPQARMEQEMSKHEQWHLTAEAAELYERYVARYILGPWAPLLADAGRLVAGERVLDVACGTGVVTRIAAERVGPTGRVIGLDLNPGMIGVARSLPRPAGAPVEWIERSALDLGLPDASVDVVFCQQGLQFFLDKALAMREMHKVLDRGGRLAASVWTGAGVYNSAVGEALERFLNGESAARFCASRKVPSREELRSLAIDAGFADVKVQVSRIDMHLPRLDRFVLQHLSATPVAAEIAACDPESREKIGESVMKKLRDYADEEGVSYPEEAHILTGRV